MKEVFLYFLKLGCIGFGGPLAIVAQIQRDLIEDRKWMPLEEFRSVFGLIKSMPGPVAVQTAIYLGRHRAGFPGAFLAFLGLIFPSFVLMIALAIGYQKITSMDWMLAILGGMKVGALALIVYAMKSLSESYRRSGLFIGLFVLNLLAIYLFKVSEPVLILLSGYLAVLIGRKGSYIGVFATTAGVASQGVFIGFDWGNLIWICFKAGAFVFGTGLAIVPLLETDFVQKLGWISHNEFMDALSFGQLTPGPVVMTVTFLGYKVAGFAGALVATLMIFLPGFVHMTTWFPRLVGWLLKQKWIVKATEGITAAVIATIFSTSISLFSTLSIYQKYGLFACLVVLVAISLPSWALIVISGLVGFLVQFA